MSKLHYTLSSFDDENQGDKPLLERMKHEAKAISFGLLYAMLKETKRSKKWVYLGAIIEVLQLLAFPFALVPSLVENVPNTGTLVGLSDMVSMGSYIEGDSSSFSSIHVTAVLLVFLALIDAIYVGWAHSKDTFHALWPVRLLRFGVSMFVTVGYIPVLTILTKAWTIENAVSTPLQVIGGLATLAFVPLSLAFSLVFFEPSPRSGNLTSRPHSRVQFATLVVKTLLVLLSASVELAPKFSSSHPHITGYLELVLVGVMLGSAVLLSIVNPVFLPFYAPVMNNFRSFLFGAWMWVTIYCTLVSTSVMTHGSPTFWTGWWACAAAMTLLTVASWRYWCSFKPILDTEAGSTVSPKQFWPTPYHVEIAARAMLQNAHDPANPGNMLMAVDSVFKAGLTKFKSSGFLHAMYVVHLSYYCPTSKAVISVIEKSKTKKQLFDGEFLIFRIEQDRSRLATTAKDSGSAGMNFLAQLEFRRSMEMVQVAHKTTLRSVRAFWKLMLRSDVDFAALQSKSAAVQQAIIKTERTLTGLMRRFPSSPSVFRAYAAYLSQIRNDTTRAEDFFSKADALETDLAKSRKNQSGPGTVSARGLMDEDSAFIAVNGSGAMAFVSVQAAWMFGYNKRDMVGQSLSMILPQELSKNHSEAIERFVGQGQSHFRPTFHGGEDSEQVLVGRHASGSMFVFNMSMAPVLLHGEEIFVGTLSSNVGANGATGGKKLFLQPESMKVMGSTPEAAEWLGFEGSELNGMPLSAIIPSFSHHVSEAMREGSSKDPTPQGSSSSLSQAPAAVSETAENAEAVNSTTVPRWYQRGTTVDMEVMSREFGSVTIHVTPQPIISGRVIVLEMMVPRGGPRNVRGPPNLAHIGSPVTSAPATPSAPLRPVPEEMMDETRSANSDLRSRRSSVARSYFGDGETMPSPKSSRRDSDGSLSQSAVGEDRVAGGVGGGAGLWGRLQRRLVQESTRQSDGVKLLHTVVLSVTLMFAAIGIGTMFVMSGIVQDLHDAIDPLALAESRHGIVMNIARTSRYLQLAHMGIYDGEDQESSLTSLSETLESLGDDLGASQKTLFELDLGGAQIGPTGFDVPLQALIPVEGGGFYLANGTEVTTWEADVSEAMLELSYHARLLATEAEPYQLNTTDASDNNPHMHFAVRTGPEGVTEGSEETTEAVVDLLFLEIEALNSFAMASRVYVIVTCMGLIWCSIRPVVYLVAQEKRSSMTMFTALDAITIQTLAARRQSLIKYMDEDEEDEDEDSDLDNDEFDEDEHENSHQGPSSEITKSGGKRRVGKVTRRSVYNVDASTSGVHKRYVTAGLVLMFCFLANFNIVNTISDSSQARGIEETSHRASMLHSVDFALAELLADPTSEAMHDLMREYLDELESVNGEIAVADTEDAFELAYGDSCSILGDCTEEEEAQVSKAGGCASLVLVYITEGRALVEGPPEDLVLDNPLVQDIRSAAGGVTYRCLSWTRDATAEGWKASLESSLVTMRVTTIVVCCISLAMYVLVYRPMVTFLIKEMSSIGFMISLVPVSAIEKNRSIKRFLLRATRSRDSADGVNGAGSVDEAFAAFKAKQREEFKAMMCARAGGSDVKGEKVSPQVRVQSSEVSGEDQEAVEGPSKPSWIKNAVRFSMSRGGWVESRGKLTLLVLGLNTVGVVIALLMGAPALSADDIGAMPIHLVGGFLSGSTPFGQGVITGPFAESIYGLAPVDRTLVRFLLDGLVLGSASLWIWLAGLPVETRLIRKVCLTAGATTALTLMINPRPNIDQGFSVAVFSVFVSVSIAGPLVRRKWKGAPKVFSLTDSEGFLNGELTWIGVNGGILAATTGSSLDALVFVMCVFFYRLDVRVASLTAVVCGGVNALVATGTSWFMAGGPTFVPEAAVPFALIAWVFGSLGAIAGAYWIQNASESLSFYLSIAIQPMIMIVYTSEVGQQEESNSTTTGSFYLGVLSMSTLLYLVGVGGLVRQTVVESRTKSDD